MEKLNVDSIKTLMTTTLEFLNPFLPIANAHASNFIVEDHWETLLSNKIQHQLLLLSDDELRNLPIHQQHNLKVKEWDSLTQKHSNDGPKESIKCDNIIEPGKILQSDRSLVEWKCSDLNMFCQGASNCSVNSYDISIQKDKLMAQLKQSQSTDFFVKEFMNQKKGHEVDVMSHVCAVLAKGLDCQLVIDFGSGKGYLGQNLCLQYGIPVLGIDAALTNTMSAEKRLKYLGKQWEGLSLNAKLSNDGLKLSKKAKKKLKNTQLDKSDIVPTSSDGTDVPLEAKIKATGNSDVDDLRLDTAVGRCGDTAKTSNYVSVTMFVDKNTDFMSIARQNFPDLMADTQVKKEVKLRSDDFQIDYKAAHLDRNATDDDTVTIVDERIESGKVTESTLNTDISQTADKTIESGGQFSCTKSLNCGDVKSESAMNSNTKDNSYLISTSSHSKTENSNSLLLTGLHTCGDLASTTLNIFVTNPKIRAVCSVGCCYNQLTEEFAPKKELDYKGTKSVYGFPMSQFLRDQKFHLGYSARNLACQSVHRMTSLDQPLQGERFFSRALLEVLVHDVSKNENVVWKGLRNLEKKCSSTEDYLRKACEKLNISNLVSQEIIEDYVKRYSDYKHKLAAFFQLRTVLAPCIESLILMDRLCYLLEQGNISQVFLVQLFDPVISPRCYGIVAMKH